MRTLPLPQRVLLVIDDSPTKLQLAARLVQWLVPILKRAGKTVWIVIDGGYTKRPFLGRVLKIPKVVVVGRLRKDAALRDLPPQLKRGERRGRPRKYGKHKISIAKRAGQRRGWQTVDCQVYGQPATKTCKTFLATSTPNVALRTPTDVKPCDNTFSATNYPPSQPPGGCREK
ncbi:MAG: transposase [Planctomycetia bacterium]|nr:transposase [Planctomycetia bacterium]